MRNFLLTFLSIVMLLSGSAFAKTTAKDKAEHLNWLKTKNAKNEAYVLHKDKFVCLTRAGYVEQYNKILGKGGEYNPRKLCCGCIAYDGYAYARILEEKNGIVKISYIMPYTDKIVKVRWILKAELVKLSDLKKKFIIGNGGWI